MNNRIKCGKCKSEYFPRIKSCENIILVSEYDYSCPVCGHGKFEENYKSQKKILIDSKNYD